MNEQVRMIKLCDMEKHPRNSEFLPPQTVEELRGLRERLAINLEPHAFVVVENKENGKYRILDGNTRFDMLVDLEVEDFPCIVKQHMTEEEQLNYMVAFGLSRRNLTPEQKKSIIIKLKECGHKNKDIASMVGVSERTVRRQTTEFSEAERQKRENRDAEIKALYEGGNTQEQIAEKAGVSRSMVSKIVTSQSVNTGQMTDTHIEPEETEPEETEPEETEDEEAEDEEAEDEEAEDEEAEDEEAEDEEAEDEGRAEVNRMLLENLRDQIKTEKPNYLIVRESCFFDEDRKYDLILQQIPDATIESRSLIHQICSVGMVRLRPNGLMVVCLHPALQNMIIHELLHVLDRWGLNLVCQGFLQLNTSEEVHGNIVGKEKIILYINRKESEFVRTIRPVIICKEETPREALGGYLSISSIDRLTEGLVRKEDDVLDSSASSESFFGWALSIKEINSFTVVVEDDDEAETRCCMLLTGRLARKPII